MRDNINQFIKDFSKFSVDEKEYLLKYFFKELMKEKMGHVSKRLIEVRETFYKEIEDIGYPEE